MSGDCKSQGTELSANICSNLLVSSEANISDVGLEKVDAIACTISQDLEPGLLKKPADIKAEHSAEPHTSLRDIVTGSLGTNMVELQAKNTISSDFANDLDHIVLKERRRILLERKMLGFPKPSVEGMPANSNLCNGVDYTPAIKNSVPSPYPLNLVKVKTEPLDTNELNKPDTNAAGKFSFNTMAVKNELNSSEEVWADEVDHMQLRDRIKVMATKQDSNLNILGAFECLRKLVPPFGHSPSVYEAPNKTRVNHPRKRKKTATDSVETALEEDAPGLLQVLVEQGISVDEIKLFGETETDEPIDDSFIEDSFTELEAVMSKLFPQRGSLLKLAPIRCMKGSKPSYCLACLFSLVEQTRYLRFRNWPAEWGWCRDLQSFIFVFERHKRIVMERPEYGYATYFFELVDSSPIDWQIKRLMTAMKLTNCGRISLIENKALSVGEDLTEGEAKVLMHYGWTPNSGLGTMLNYCDRVVHDRKNEKDHSEWRSKIGKLLMDGYNGGIIVSTNTQMEVTKSGENEKPPVKMEL